MKKDIIVKLSKIIFKYKWAYAFSFFIGVGIIIADLVFANNSRFLFDNTSNFTNELIFEILLIFAITMFAQYVLNFLAALINSYINESIIYEMRKQVLDKLQHLHIKYFDNSHSSEIMSIYYDQLEVTKNFIVFDFQNLLKLPVAFILTGGYLVSVHPYLGIIAFVAAALQLISNFTFNKKIKHAIELQRKVTEDVFFTMGEAMNGIREIKINQIEPLINERMYNCQKRGVKHNLTLVKYTTLRDMLREIPTKIGYLLGIGTGIYLMINGNITSGGLVAFITLLSKMAEPFNGIVDIYKNFQITRTKAKSLFSTLDLPTENLEKGNKLPDNIESIKFDDVSFSYDENTEKILNHINFEIKGGDTIALVGPSGSGKSTIVKLLYRFYNPTNGEILINDKPVQEYKINNLREKMSLVSQDIFIFDGTIKENITLGNSNYSETELNNAIIYSQSYNFINRFPNGIETEIGERGNKLSQGQKQRIAIARAIIKKSDILILDEPTSALDVETENDFQMGLNTWAKGCTKIIIAHRLTTIRDANYVVFIENGEIVEKGTPKELLSINGRFKDYWDKQIVFKSEEEELLV